MGQGRRLIYERARAGLGWRLRRLRTTVHCVRRGVATASQWSPPEKRVRMTDLDTGWSLLTERVVR
jgi:hypothetical protein